MRHNASYQLATIAAILCHDEQLRRSQLPLPPRSLRPEMFLGDALELVRKAEAYIESDHMGIDFKPIGT